jgi:hypothetical protein
LLACRLGLAISLAIAILAGAASGRAASLLFSNYSGDSTPASVLQATLSFQVVGSTLLVEATNQTTAAAPYDIHWFDFNASSDVRELSLVGYNDPYWTLYDDGYWVTTPVFGVFDYSLVAYGTSQPDAYIQPGELQGFTLAIDCAPGAVCDASDFTSQVSSGGWVSPLAAMRFVRLGVDAAFGASTTALAVPEPRTAVLVALGIAAIAAARRRARSPGAS